MNAILKKITVLLLTLIACISLINFNKNEACASNASQYLVLVQQKDGNWKEYKNIIEKSSTGDLMIKTKSISKALGFSYKNNSNGTFVIKRSSTSYNTYTKNSKEFTYTNGSMITKKSASNMAYTSKTSKYNLCQVSSLNTLVNFKYFNSVNTKDYPSYSGVICYSKYNTIPTSVPTSTPEPTTQPTPTPEPEPTTIIIEGVEFTVRDNFLSLDEAGSDWGGTSSTWAKLEQAVDGKILDTTDLSIGINTIEYSNIGAGCDGVYLTQTSYGYKLSISVKLGGSVIADQNAAIVKAMVVTISSKPSSVYTAIFESFTTDDTHGINEDNYVKIGDCKVKVEIKDGDVIYHIKV